MQMHMANTSQAEYKLLVRQSIYCSVHRVTICNFSTWMTTCHHGSNVASFSSNSAPPKWGVTMDKAKVAAKQHNVEMDKIMFCTCCTFTTDLLLIHHLVEITIGFIENVRITAEQTSSENGLKPADNLYFHRNPFARSSPREFWGFFSTSPDPCVANGVHENSDWIVCYQV